MSHSVPFLPPCPRSREPRPAALGWLSTACGEEHGTQRLRTARASHGETLPHIDNHQPR